MSSGIEKKAGFGGQEGTSSSSEIAQGERFAFGENWKSFLAILNEDRIEKAISSLRGMLDVEDLEGKTFLDIGSGSGLFSLAARRMGAAVHSFDYDPSSVWCTAELRRRYFPDDKKWEVERGSILDENFLKSLGQFDVVYAWGVLHHTGALWKSFELVTPLVKPKGGKLFLAVYNDQGPKSRRWRLVKRVYCKGPNVVKWLILGFVAVAFWGRLTLWDLVRMKPFASWKGYYRDRGMSPWRDIVDWAGGYPFEVARPDHVFEFFRRRGFSLAKMVNRNGGNNEFVFQLDKS
jgi:2-polyprenyl-6-hydroxyphenyl methylase/3-demethylubiquinone-9 3-methyltransferase